MDYKLKIHFILLHIAHSFELIGLIWIGLIILAKVCDVLIQNSFQMNYYFFNFLFVHVRIDNQLVKGVEDAQHVVGVRPHLVDVKAANARALLVAAAVIFILVDDNIILCEIGELCKLIQFVP